MSAVPAIVLGLGITLAFLVALVVYLRNSFRKSLRNPPRAKVSPQVVSAIARGDIASHADYHPEAIRPGPPWDGPRKAPWKPRVSGAIGLAFGPVAAALITFVNLRRLDSPRKARWVLGLTSVGSVLLGSFTYLMQEKSGYWLSSLNILIAPLYSILQTAEFDAWRARNPVAKSQNGWYATGWGLIGLVVFLALAIIGTLPWLMPDMVQSIDVQRTHPQSVTEGARMGAACQPEKMVRVVVHDITELTVPRSRLVVSLILRQGSQYGHIEDKYNSDSVASQLSIVNEPDVWTVARGTMKGNHTLDPGPTFNFRAPVLWSRGLPDWLRDFEYGCELKFMKAESGSQPAHVTQLNGEAVEVYKLKRDGYMVILMVRAKDKKPVSASLHHGKDDPLVLRYDEYADDLALDLTLFKRPQGVR